MGRERLFFVALHGRDIRYAGSNAVKILPIASRRPLIHILAKQWQRNRSAKGPRDQRIHADMLKVCLGNQSLVQIVGNCGTERRHG